MDFSVPVADVDIHHVLDMFDPEFITPEQSILKYWKSKEYTYPELFKLASIVYAVPPTEEDIMIININPELFHQVKSEEISKAFEEEEEEDK